MLPDTILQERSTAIPITLSSLRKIGFGTNPRHCLNPDPDQNVACCYAYSSFLEGSAPLRLGDSPGLLRIELIASAAALRTSSFRSPCASSRSAGIAKDAFDPSLPSAMAAFSRTYHHSSSSALVSA